MLLQQTQQRYDDFHSVREQVQQLDHQADAQPGSDEDDDDSASIGGDAYNSDSGDEEARAIDRHDVDDRTPSPQNG